jgi:signal transduction histidine kinase
MAAHDLRNPLGVVLGYAEFLGSHLDELPAQEAKEILETMRGSCAHMTTLIDDLLDVSAIESGTLVLKPTLESPTDVATQVVAQRSPLAEAKNISLVLEAEPVPAIPLDRPRFEQVLDNLIGNAIKYSNAGTEVSVRVSADAERVRIAVQDHGIGIDPAFLPRLFRPFEKAQRAGTSGEKSTGLGLAIVQRVVNAHGGSITVESEVGQGSVFTVLLPIPGP